MPTLRPRRLLTLTLGAASLAVTAGLVAAPAANAAETGGCASFSAAPVPFQACISQSGSTQLANGYINNTVAPSKCRAQVTLYGASYSGSFRAVKSSPAVACTSSSRLPTVSNSQIGRFYSEVVVYCSDGSACLGGRTQEVGDSPILRY